MSKWANPAPAEVVLSPNPPLKFLSFRFPPAFLVSSHIPPNPFGRCKNLHSELLFMNCSLRIRIFHMKTKRCLKVCFPENLSKHGVAKWLWLENVFNNLQLFGNRLRFRHLYWKHSSTIFWNKVSPILVAGTRIHQCINSAKPLHNQLSTLDKLIWPLLYIYASAVGLCHLLVTKHIYIGSERLSWKSVGAMLIGVVTLAASKRTVFSARWKGKACMPQFVLLLLSPWKP